MRTWETVTERDIATLAEWVAGEGRSPASMRMKKHQHERLLKRARSRGNNGHFAALKRIAEMINNKQGPWAPAKEP
jgi:hypothetical protein